MGQWFEDQRAALHQVKSELIDTGFFNEIEYLEGWCPVQAEGRLNNGNWFYFRSRHETATLEIAAEPWKEPYLQKFEEVVSESPSGAGYLEASRVKALLLRWIPQALEGTK